MVVIEVVLIKWVYQFSIAELTPLTEPGLVMVPDFPVVEKFLEKDLMKDLRKTKGLILEKIEGMAITKGHHYAPPQQAV